MYQRFFYTIFLLLVFARISKTVKIGISKPVSIPENVTTELIETTTIEPSTSTSTTTMTTTTIRTTARVIQTTKSPKTTVTTPTMPTTTSSTTATSTTTSLPSTTAAPNQKNITQPSPIRNQNIDYSGYFCICDLRHQYCDINCCCDIDCIPEEVNSFDCHREEARLEDLHFQQGLPSCKINGGWLCVFRNNAENTKFKEHNYVLDIATTYEWPNLLLETNDPSKDQSYYKIGEPILVYNLGSNEIVEYDISFSLFGHHCQTFESIRHLTPQKTSCHISLEKARNLEAILFQKLSTSFLLQRPNTRIPMDGIIKDTQTEYISITLNRCTNEFDCNPATIANYTFDNNEDFDYSYLIQTKIYHNITNLISCDVFFVRSDQTSQKVWQHYEVNFIHVNETDEIPYNVSGPLGYNNGGPLIIGQKILLNETADHIDSNLILSYFHPNRTEIIHIHVPRRRRDRCEESQSTVNFGESIQVQCSVQLMENSTELSSDTNFTRVCGELQTRSLEFLQVSKILGLQEDYLISILGYPKNKTDSWLKVEVVNYEHLPVIGAYLDNDYAFICQNMILEIKYKFLTVTDDIEGVPQQNVLKRATVEVGRRHDLQFDLDEMISVPITFSAIFQDLRELSNAIRWVTCWKIIFISIFILI